MKQRRVTLLEEAILDAVHQVGDDDADPAVVPVRYNCQDYVVKAHQEDDFTMSVSITAGHATT